MFEETVQKDTEETNAESGIAEESIQPEDENTEKDLKKIKIKKLNKNRDNKFPREDRNEDVTREGINPRQFSEAWTTCSRCRDQILSFGKSTHFIDGYQYCGNCYDFVKNDFSSNADWARNSDERKKRNIENDTLGLEFINDLRTVTFQWKPAEEHPEAWHAWKDVVDDDGEETGEKEYHEMNTDVVMHGMIAQEVKSALDTAGVDTFGGWKLKDPENADGQQLLSSGMFIFPLIKAVQELTARLEIVENA